MDEGTFTKLFFLANAIINSADNSNSNDYLIFITNNVTIFIRSYSTIEKLLGIGEVVMDAKRANRSIVLSSLAKGSSILRDEEMGV